MSSYKREMNVVSQFTKENTQTICPTKETVKLGKSANYKKPKWF